MTINPACVTKALHWLQNSTLCVPVSTLSYLDTLFEVGTTTFSRQLRQNHQGDKRLPYILDDASFHSKKRCFLSDVEQRARFFPYLAALSATFASAFYLRMKTVYLEIMIVEVACLEIETLLALTAAL